MSNNLQTFTRGFIKENPILVLLLGCCPTLATTTSAINGMSMGLATTFVLIMSNLVISLLRKVIPDQVRLPCYIVIVASLVTATELLIQAYLPDLYSALGIYIPLIVVNCIILGRAEAYANKNSPGLAVMDGLGMGIGFTVALTLAGLVREILGNGTAFGLQIMPESFEPIGIFVQPPGAFIVIAVFIMIMNAIGIKTRQRKLVESECDGCCAKCASRCEKAEEVADK